MSNTLKSYARSIGAAGTGLALAGMGALPMSASAGDDHSHPPAVAAVEATANQMAVRDATTGLLRVPTADEAKALAPPAAQKTGRAADRLSTLTRYHASGAQGARLSDEFMNYSVVVRQPDGSMATRCFHTKEEADAALKAPSTTAQNNSAPTE